MRTTFDIADDVYLAAKEVAARERRSLGEVVSELARAGLRHGVEAVGASRAGVPARRGRFAVLPARDEVISSTFSACRTAKGSDVEEEDAAGAAPRVLLDVNALARCSVELTLS